MPGRDAAPVRTPAPVDKPQPAAAVKPNKEIVTASINPSRDTVTDPIKPQELRRQAAKIPGVRFASLGAQTLPKPETKHWAPAVGYNPVVTPTKQAAPAAVRKPRRARAYRPYYRLRPSFGFAVGIPLRW